MVSHSPTAGSVGWGSARHAARPNLAPCGKSAAELEPQDLLTPGDGRIRCRPQPSTSGIAARAALAACRSMHSCAMLSRERSPSNSSQSRAGGRAWYRDPPRADGRSASMPSPARSGANHLSAQPALLAAMRLTVLDPVAEKYAVAAEANGLEHMAVVALACADPPSRVHLGITRHLPALISATAAASPPSVTIPNRTFASASGDC
jgi:hypothetical protein